MSWWDYGYQITAIANRTVLVDNNTWNNTHISRVGQAMSSTEDRAYEIMRELDVDYVLVIFGGYVGYSSDGASLCISLCIWVFNRIRARVQKLCWSSYSYGTVTIPVCMHLQTSTSSCGWCVSAGTLSAGGTSKSPTTTRRRVSSASTRPARPRCSTASCTR